MTRKLTTLFAAAAIVTGLGAVTAFADGAAQPSQHGAGMMTGQGGMMGQMDPDQMKRMMQMVENCNHMMETMNNMPMQPDGEHNPGPKG